MQAPLLVGVVKVDGFSTVPMKMASIPFQEVLAAFAVTAVLTNGGVAMPRVPSVSLPMTGVR